jgi:hypothetical protein
MTTYVERQWKAVFWFFIVVRKLGLAEKPYIFDIQDIVTRFRATKKGGGMR